VRERVTVCVKGERECEREREIHFRSVFLSLIWTKSLKKQGKSEKFAYRSKVIKNKIIDFLKILSVSTSD
jgi:hypothetical protein